jgi:hypothetical protein
MKDIANRSEHDHEENTYNADIHTRQLTLVLEKKLQCGLVASMPIGWLDRQGADGVREF